MHMVIGTIVGGCASIDAGGGMGCGAAGHALFCGLIWVDGKRRHWPGASSNPSPKDLGNIGGVGNDWPIAVDGEDIDADLFTEVPPLRPLRRTLLASCKVAGVVAPTYTWEQWQLRWKLSMLLFLVATWWAGGPWMMSDEVLPCTWPHG
jgi:hypothetical protein